MLEKYYVIVTVSEVSAGDYGSEWINRMVNAVNTEFPITPISQQTSFEFQINTRISKVSWFEQFVILSKRRFLQLRRNKVQKYSIIKNVKSKKERYLTKSFHFFQDYMYLKICLHIFVGFIIGGLFVNIGNDGSKIIYNIGFCLTCLIFLLYVPMLPILMHCKKITIIKLQLKEEN